MSKVLNRSWDDSPAEEAAPPFEPLTPLAPIDYRKAPMRAALVQAAQILDERNGALPGHTLINSAAQILIDAMNGDKTAIQFIADRFDGKPAQALQVTGEDGGPVQFADVSQLEVARRIAFLLSRGVNLLPTTADPPTKTLKRNTYDG